MTLAREGTVDLHGVTVRWRTAAELSDDAAARILARFPAAATGGRRGAIELSVEPRRARDALVPAEHRETCFFGPVRGYAGPDGALVLTDGASRVRLDARASRIDAERDPATDAQTFAGVMLVVALVIALRHRGLFHLHAAALVHPSPEPAGTPWLIVGGSGAGKTTTTLALLASGLDYLSDDATLLTAADGAPALCGVPREFHLTAATLAAFPALRPFAQPPVREGWPKHPVDPRAAFPGRERARVGAPGVLLFPQVTAGARTEIARLTPADALGELLLASAWIAIDGLPRASEHLALLSALVRAGRALRVTLGRDTLDDPALLRARIEAALRDG